MNNQAVVIDTYAFFAYVNSEAGSEIVEELLEKTLNRKIAIYLHRINWGELYYKTFKESGKQAAEEIIKKVDKLSVLISDVFSEEFVKQVATIKGKYPVSYADAFAINLALSKNISLVTGDPEITKLAKKEPHLKLFWR